MTFEELHEHNLKRYPPTAVNLILYPELYRDYLDEKDEAIRRDRQAARDKRSGIMMQGDFVRFADRSIRRITALWPSLVQTTPGGGDFYLHDTGHGDYSGGHDRGTPRDLFTLASDRMEGHFWFFSHNISDAGRSKNCKIECQVWDCASLPPKF